MVSAQRLSEVTASQTAHEIMIAIQEVQSRQGAYFEPLDLLKDVRLRFTGKLADCEKQ